MNNNNTPRIYLNDNTNSYIPTVTCKLYNIEDLQVLKLSKSTSLLNLNIRSLRRNFSVLESFISLHQFSYDVIAVTETWLSPEEDHIFNLTGYKKYSTYRNRNGGGIVIYVANHFETIAIDELSYVSDDIEILSLKVRNHCFSFNVVCIYRPPSRQIENFNTILQTSILPKLICYNNQSILTGDFNINLFNPHKLSSIDTFVNILISFNYFSLIDQPTRLSPHNNVTKYSLLDQIWCNFITVNNISSGVFNIELSDHLPVMCHFYLDSTMDLGQFTFRNFKIDRNREKFIDLIRSTDFNVLLDSNNNNPNISMSLVTKKLYDKMNQSFPLKTMKNKNKSRHSEWMNSDLKRLITKKNRLLKLSREGKITRRSYNVYRNLLVSLIRKTKRYFYHEKLNNLKSNSKKLWAEMNKLVGRKRVNDTLKLVINGVSLSSLDMCNIFNQHFCSIAIDISNSIPNVTLPLEIYSNPVTNSFVFYEISYSELYEVITNFKNKKFHKNEIQPEHLMSIIDQICPILCRIFNHCFHNFIFPDCLKIARVVPIFKSGSRNVLNNYRPISNSNIFNKIFERIIKNRLSDFIENENFITECQYGFRKDSSTTLAIQNFLGSILDSFDRGFYTVTLFLDLKKAFDTIDINILIRKLEFYGFRDGMTDFFRNYFDNRKQYVNINDCNSDFNDIQIGLTQGAILSPTLFNIFINDIGNFSQQFDFHATLFADDAAFCTSGPDFNALILKLNTFISALSKYLNMNKLTPNVQKTKLMLFTHKKDLFLPPVYFNDVELEWVNDFKYLGVHVDNKLSFNSHVKFLCKKLSSVQGLLLTSSNFLNIHTMTTLYYSLVYSIVSQSIIIYGNTFSCHLQPLKIILNKIVRIIFRIKYDDNHIPLTRTNTMYYQNKLLKFDDIRNFYLVKFVKKALYDDPALLVKYFPNCIPIHHYHTRHFKLILPLVRSETTKRSFVYQAILNFNNLPENLTLPMSNILFKKRYRDFIFEKYRIELP